MRPQPALVALCRAHGILGTARHGTAERRVLERVRRATLKQGRKVEGCTRIALGAEGTKVCTLTRLARSTSMDRGEREAAGRTMARHDTASGNSTTMMVASVQGACV